MRKTEAAVKQATDNMARILHVGLDAPEDHSRLIAECIQLVARTVVLDMLSQSLAMTTGACPTCQARMVDGICPNCNG